MSDERPEVVHHHYHHHESEAYERLIPPSDVLATHDALGRKVPKRLGAMEVCRAVPALAAQFNKMVPADHFVIDQGQAIVNCVCDQVVYIDWNRMVPCGNCDRWFFFIGEHVRVARLAGSD